MAERQPQTVLLVDDSQDIHDIATVRLRAEYITLHHVYDADGAVAFVEKRRPDLILLDIDLPDIDGLTLCRNLKIENELYEVPIIFLTGTIETSVKVQAFELGAVDYVTKPFDAIELRARVTAALRTKRYYDMLATQAQIDALTGLYNRNYFDKRLSEELADIDRHGHSFCILMVDIDHFKAVNDTYGHPFGDAVLRAFADVFPDILRESDVVCRYGGEEFIVLLRQTTVESASQVAERLRQRVTELNLSRADTQVSVTASFGLAGTGLLETVDASAADWLLELADRALYAAKEAGRNCVKVATDAQ